MPKALRVAGVATLVLLLTVVIGFAAIVGGMVWYIAYQIRIPDHHRMANAASVPICSGGNRTYVPFADIPPAVSQAMLAAEDPDFYTRRRFNPLMALATAVVRGEQPRAGSLMSL